MNHLLIWLKSKEVWVFVLNPDRDDDLIELAQAAHGSLTSEIWLLRPGKNPAKVLRKALRNSNLTPDYTISKSWNSPIPNGPFAAVYISGVM